ncbi:DUF4349 domain-containing protein [Sorangium sp. So ce1335]|uniref:DUF4349 domain-containing protein n=1 Tax=Sorangium sp. So ce1335 TaxID=3133335 RepID=UPI003F6365C5
MRRTLPSWALLALLAGASACASSRSSASDAASAPVPMVAPAAMATGMPPQDPTTRIALSDGDAREESFIESSSAGLDTTVTTAELAKAVPPATAASPASPPPTARPAPGSTAPVAGTARPAPTGQAVAATAQAGASPQGAAAAPQGAAAVRTSASPAPLLVYTAQIAMAVFEVSASLGKVEALAQELGGFLARRDDQAITIRVPAARFDEALKRLEGLGDMLQRNVVAEDVTEEFLDLGVRIRNARAVRDRLEKLLDKATKVEESIQLERELARVTSELERLEGRLKYLRDRIAFSTLTVSFQPRSTEAIAPSGPRLPIDWLNELGLSRLLNL